MVLQEACAHLSSYMKFKLQLKPDQHNAVEYSLNHDYVLTVPPTGYGLSLIFQLFAVAASIERKEPQTVLAVCLLKSIIEDQITEAEACVFRQLPQWIYRKTSFVLPY